MFQLNREEINIIQGSQNVTSDFRIYGKGGRSYLPYAFTEQVKKYSKI